MSNLTQRILVALVTVPLILLFSMMGGFWFFGMVLLISTIALHEFYTLGKQKGASPQVAAGLAFGALVVSSFLWERLRSGDIALAFPQVLVMLFLLFVPLIMLAEMFRNKGSALTNIGFTLFGVCYVSLFLGSLVGVRELFASGSDAAAYDRGGLTLATIFVSIWICDSLAYFAGKFLGRHKLFERVSPNKTWEGAGAGYVGAVATFLVAQNFFLPFMTVGNALVCGSIVGIVGQMGDLAESLLKRDAGVKDSSTLIPGHGGALDRFDSLMFVSPMMFLYLEMFVV